LAVRSGHTYALEGRAVAVAARGEGTVHLRRVEGVLGRRTARGLPDGSRRLGGGQDAGGVPGPVTCLAAPGIAGQRPPTGVVGRSDGELDRDLAVLGQRERRL